MTKDELKKLSQQTFFDNNEGLISPDGHRKYNEAVIDTMAMDEDVQKLANPDTPKHAQPTVVDEVLRNARASWCRSNNHVVYISPNIDVPAQLPIGEVVTTYSMDRGYIEMDRKTYGPALKMVDAECYFMVFQAGDYLLVQKKYKNIQTDKKITVTEAQAKAGYRINFDDGVTSSTKFAGGGKDLRTITRLYYETNGVYQNVNYSLPAGAVFKYSSESIQFPNAIAGGADVGMGVYEIKARGPIFSRQGCIVTIRSIVRRELILRPTFSVAKNVPVVMGLFIEPKTGYDGRDYELWYKKSKTWHYKNNNKRYVHRIVGYIKVNDRTPEQMLYTGLRPHDVPIPQFIDFQIRMKNAEKTVVAQYRATCESHLDDLGNPVEYGVVFRRR